MARDDSDFPTSSKQPLDEYDELAFLHDEGLDLLASFKKVRDRSKRDLIRALVNALGEGGHRPERFGL